MNFVETNRMKCFEFQGVKIDVTYYILLKLQRRYSPEKVRQN